MKPLNFYHVIDKEWIVYKSKICSVVCSLEYSQEVDLSNELNNRIGDLTKSYLNQWQFVISAYDKLYNLFFDLNSTSDISENLITEYDIYSIEKEKEFRDYTYLLVISLKTFLDLFACLVDITISQEIKPEEKMPSFHSFAKSKNFTNHQIAKAFEDFRDKQKFPWIDLLNESRNRLIHRGYHLKPEFHFKKGNELTMIIYKGTDLYFDTLKIEVGKLFDDFMNNMNLIDEQVSTILISTITKLENHLKVNVSYKFGDEITEFSYSET